MLITYKSVVRTHPRLLNSPPRAAAIYVAARGSIRKKDSLLSRMNKESQEWADG
jgi:hypothetical protein